MRSGKILILLMLLCVPGVTHAQSVWTHQPAGSTVLLDCPMSSISGCARLVDQYGNLNSQTVINLADPVSPPNGIRMFLPYTGPCGDETTIGTYLPCANGGGTAYWFHTTQMREIYVGIIARSNVQEGCNIIGSSKDWFVMSYNAALGAPIMNGVFMSRGCGQTKTHVFAHNTGIVQGTNVQLDNSHACADPYGATCYPNVGPGTYQADQIVKFQYCLKAGSGLTNRDAIVAWSINDVWAGVYQNLNYGVNNLNELQWNKTLDGYGNGQGFTGELQQEIYHIRIAMPPNGGCAGMIAGQGGGTTPPSPTPPPPSPTPPPATTNPGTVSDLTVTPQSATTAKMTFTAVHDGAGNPAKYDNRLALSPISWGAAASISVGTCASPFMPSNAIGQQIECLITGLSAGQSYQSQNASFRGTMNAGAIYGGLSNVASFTMPSSNEPVITTFTPSSGIAGVSVTISGLNFSATLANNTVKFNGQPAVVTAASTGELTVTVPDGVTTGRISIQTDQGIVYSDQNFSVGASGGGCGCS
jgi:hypothetical protein